MLDSLHVALSRCELRCAYQFFDTKNKGEISVDALLKLVKVGVKGINSNHAVNKRSRYINPDHEGKDTLLPTECFTQLRKAVELYLEDQPGTHSLT